MYLLAHLPTTPTTNLFAAAAKAAADAAAAAAGERPAEAEVAPASTLGWLLRAAASSFARGDDNAGSLDGSGVNPEGAGHVAEMLKVNKTLTSVRCTCSLA